MHRTILHHACWLAGVPALLWGVGALAFTPAALGAKLAVLLAALLLIVAIRRLAPRVPAGLLALCGGVLAAALLRPLPEPALARTWIAPQARLASAAFVDGVAAVRNVRNFRYDDAGNSSSESWEDRRYNPMQIETAWLGVSPFSVMPGVGHAFVSFGFADGQFLAVSVEARREEGEAYDPLRGLFRAYEIVYVLADERDLIGLRTQVWGDNVYLYPIRATREAMRAVFLDMLDRVNDLAQTPEFYDTLSNSCSVSLARHVNAVVPGAVPMTSLKLVLAGYSGALAHDLGLLDFDGPFDQAQARFRVNDRAAGGVDAADFSQRIRAR